MRFHARVFAGAVLALASACATQPAAEKKIAVAGARTPTKPVFVQKDLIGQKGGALDEMLGKAALSRREGAGEFRRYAFDACTLIIILYPDEKGALSAERLDAAAKVSGEETPDLDACLARGPEKKAD
jgi:hypothetical protein